MRPSSASSSVEHARRSSRCAARRRRAARRARRARRRSATCACPSARPAARRRGPRRRRSAATAPPIAQLQRIAHAVDADALDRRAGARRARPACRGCAGRRSGWSWRRESCTRPVAARVAVEHAASTGRARLRPCAERAQWFAAGRTVPVGAEALRIDCSMPAASSPHSASSLAGSPCSMNASGRPSFSTGISMPRRGQRLEHRAAGAAHDAALFHRHDRIVAARELVTSSTSSGLHAPVSHRRHRAA